MSWSCVVCEEHVSDDVSAGYLFLPRVSDVAQTAFYNLQVVWIHIPPVGSSSEGFLQQQCQREQKQGSSLP